MKFRIIHSPSALLDEKSYDELYKKSILYESTGFMVLGSRPNEILIYLTDKLSPVKVDLSKEHVIFYD